MLLRHLLVSFILALSYVPVNSEAASWPVVDPKRGDFKYIMLYKAIFDTKFANLSTEIGRENPGISEEEFADQVFLRGGFLYLFKDTEKSAWKYLADVGRLPSKDDIPYKKYADVVFFAYIDEAQLDLYKKCRIASCRDDYERYKVTRIEIYDRFKRIIVDAINGAKR